MSIEREYLLDAMDTRHALFGLCFAFGNRLQTAGDSFYEEITCKQFFLLVCLSLFEDTPPTINELSETMGSSHQNVKQIINKLEKAGFIISYYDKEDKRKIRIKGTEKIAMLGDKYRLREEEFMERFYEGLTEDEIECTFRAMSKMERNLINIREENTK